MVNQKATLSDKPRAARKGVKVLLIIFVVILILLIVFVPRYLNKKPSNGSGGGGVETHLENPISQIVLKNTNEAGYVNKSSVVQEGIVEFDEEYINFILIALGTGYLHKSSIFGTPKIEFNLGEESWNSEIFNGNPVSKKGSIDNEDLRISISKEEAVNALLSEDITKFMKDSVTLSGNTKIEMVAGKTELFSKGYLDMYNRLTK